jgi:hypothetical protein
MLDVWKYILRGDIRNLPKEYLILYERWGGACLGPISKNYIFLIAIYIKKRKKHHLMHNLWVNYSISCC